MADLLPDEILLRILDDGLAGWGEWDLHRDWQSTLAKACLASRRLCLLAQPVLHGQIFIWPHLVDPLAQIEPPPASGVLGRHTKSWSVWLGDDLYPTLVSVLPSAAAVPNLVELFLGPELHTLHLPLLAVYTKLRCLSLYGIWLDDPTPATLSGLEQLSLHSVETSVDYLSRWLVPAHLPALRVLEVVGVFDEGVDAFFLPFRAIVSPAMLDQLDVAHVDMGEPAPDDPLWHGSTPPILMGLGAAPVSHRYFYGGLHFRNVELFAEEAARLIDAIRALPPAVGEPFVLVVPHGLRVQAANTPTVSLALERLERACADKQVVLLWASETSKGRCADLFWPEFIQYARELKARRLGQPSMSSSSR